MQILVEKRGGKLEQRVGVTKELELTGAGRTVLMKAVLGAAKEEVVRL